VDKDREMKKLRTRLETGMSAAGIKGQSELARRLSLALGREFPRQTVNYWFKNSSEVSFDHATLYALADIFNMNARWIAEGPPNTPTRPKMVGPNESEVLELYESLKKHDEDALDQWLKQGRKLATLVSPRSASNPLKVKSS
jgi:transcriptional regulator with XRE-family HTH domain